MKPSPAEQGSFEADAEKAVLGALLIDGAMAWPLVSGVLVESDFASTSHAIIFDSVSRELKIGKAADPVTISDCLERAGSLQKVGGLAYLFELARAVLSPANAGEYARIVVEASVRRVARIVLADASAALFRGDPAAVLGGLQGRIGALIERGTGGSDVTMLDAARAALDDLDRRVDLRRREQPVGIPTGLKGLDRLMGGLEPGLIVLAALTSQGKSALAWHIVMSAGLSGTPSGVVSLEMSAAEIARRAFSRLHGVPLSDLLKGSERAFDELIEKDHRTPLAKLPIRIDDASTSIEQVSARITTWVRRHGVRLIVVDYLQLIAVRGEETRQLEVARVTRELKRLAMSLNVPIIGISQFSRAAAHSASLGDRPELHHLRDSGSVEQDADAVLVLWRTPEQRAADRYDRPRECYLTVLKARNGAVGDAYGPTAGRPLLFDSAIQTFLECDPNAADAAGRCDQTNRTAERRSSNGAKTTAWRRRWQPE
jgi:replicative DNA helicase